MKRLVLLIVIIFSSFTVSGQEGFLLKRFLSARDTIILKTDIEVIQYSLGRFYKERQIASYLAVGSLSLVCLSYPLVKFTDRDLGMYSIIGAGITGLASTIIFLDAGKWLRRASVKVSPGGIKVYF
jgi:hypothetical protein